MTRAGGERSGPDSESAPPDPIVESSDPTGSDHEIEVVTVDGETTYRVDGREYADCEALPPVVRRALEDGGCGGADTASPTPPIVNDLTPEGLRALADHASEDRAGRDPANPAVGGRGHERPDRMESISLTSGHPSDDPFSATTRAIERSVGAISRWIAYFALIVWSWMEPESLGPFIFLGFFVADFVTWVAEVVLVSFAWRSRPLHPGSVGLSLLGFGVMYGLLMLTESFQVAPQEKDWAHSVGLIAFFFTLCGKTVAIGLRRASDITNGP
jgi:hypothetical protein